VLFDDLVAGVRRRVRVDAERLDAEGAAERSPQQLVVVDGDLFDLVQAHARPAASHDASLPAGTFVTARV